MEVKVELPIVLFTEATKLKMGVNQPNMILSKTIHLPFDYVPDVLRLMHYPAIEPTARDRNMIMIDVHVESTDWDEATSILRVLGEKQHWDRLGPSMQNREGAKKYGWSHTIL